MTSREQRETARFARNMDAANQNTAMAFGLWVMAIAAVLGWYG